MINEHSSELEYALKWLKAGEPVVLATVIQTWGSSPRPVGSHMVINGKCEFMGSVSGGCVEGAVISEALETLRTGVTKTVSFSVSNEDAWEVGLSCGGSVSVLLTRWLEPDLIAKAVTCLYTNVPFALMIDTTDGAAGLLVDSHWVGGDSRFIENLTLDQMAQYTVAGVSQLVAMPFGDIFIYCHRPSVHLLIIGAVHIAQALIPMARILGYQTTLIDPREAFSQQGRFEGQQVVCRWPSAAISASEIGPSSAVVTLTHDPKIDDTALEIALNSRAFYIGALGSQKTHQQRLSRLEEKGFKDALNRLHAPIGLPLGGRAPEEIALAILAQIVQTRYL